ncbi:hypothetical protein DXA32_00840 [Subdoligranulum sp. OF01-18]|nr:hypothetical protein DXA32_00840 [Subdoligranulum sp. OF01-18]
MLYTQFRLGITVRKQSSFGKTIQEFGHLLFQLIFMGDRASRGKLELQFQSSRKAIKDQMLRVRAGKGLPMCSFLGRSGIHSGGAAVIHLDAVNFRSVG